MEWKGEDEMRREVRVRLVGGGVRVRMRWSGRVRESWSGRVRVRCSGG